MNKPIECVGCPFYNVGKGFVPSYGTCSNGIALVGMAPASNELIKGEPFVGKAGRIMVMAMWKGNLKKSDYLVFNVIQCMPPDFDVISHPDGWAAINHCKVHRDKYIREFKPKALVALGALPLKVLTGVDGGVHTRGYLYNSTYSIPTVSTIHPSYLGYQSEKSEDQSMTLLPALLYDLKYAPLKGLPSFPPPMDTSPAGFCRFTEAALRQAKFLAVDIETPMKLKGKKEDEIDYDDPSFEILRMSFAFFDGRNIQSISVPWYGPYPEIARPLLASNITKLFWNYRYDLPRIKRNGYEVGGKIIDDMWRFHDYHPDLPKDLGFAASLFDDINSPEWKSKNESDEPLYSRMDSHNLAAIHMSLEGQFIRRGILPLVESRVDRILEITDKMTARGVCIDEVAYNNLKERVEDKCNELETRLQNESGLRYFSPPLGYVREPEDKTGQVKAVFMAPVRVRELCHCASISFTGKTGRTLLNPKIVRDENCSTCLGKGRVKRIETRAVERWAYPIPFTATRQQVIDWLNLNKIKIPTDKKNKTTTGKKHIKFLATKHPFLASCLEYRKYDKIRTTYLVWKIKDGRIHPKYWPSTGTGRLSSTGPNFTNIPKDGDLAKDFRKCIVASPGRKIVAADWSGAEAVLTGYCARDPDYMDLAYKGIYTFILAHYNGQVFDVKDPDLGAKLKAYKASSSEEDYKKFKITNLGIGYGLGPRAMHIENPGMFKSQGEAAKLRRFILKLFPKIEKYQEDVVNEAKDKGYLDNEYLARRWFLYIPGADATRAIAQRPQSLLANIAKETLLLVDDSWIGEYLIGFIHDEPVLDVPEGKAEQARDELQRIMERPLTRLPLSRVGREGYLSLKTEARIGDHL